MTRELTQKGTSVRTKRTPLNVRNRLSVRDKDPNYVYRIVNLTDAHGGDRLQDFIEQGYEIDPVNNGKVGDKRVDAGKGVGSIPEFSVGQGRKAVVMRQKKEWFEEDQAAKQAIVDASEQTMRNDAKNKSDYGSFNTETR